MIVVANYGMNTPFFVVVENMFLFENKTEYLCKRSLISEAQFQY